VCLSISPSSWVFDEGNITKDAVKGILLRDYVVMEVNLLAAEYVAGTLTFGLGKLSLELRKLTFQRLCTTLPFFCKLI
jgi:hypothetical protein